MHVVVVVVVVVVVPGGRVQVVVGLQEEVRQLRKDNSALDAGSHGHQKTINHLSTRVAVLEQELLDKEQVG